MKPDAEPEYNFNNLHNGEDNIEERLKQRDNNLCNYISKCKYHYHKQCNKYRDHYESCDVYQFFRKFLK